jgi:molybdenum cofactor guanylyltransferase
MFLEGTGSARAGRSSDGIVGGGATLGALVLCGGRSSRMGQSKAWLPFGPEVLLQRVVRIIAEIASPVVVVAAPDQEVPELPPEIAVVRDPAEGRGPLQGIAVGLATLADRVPYAYVSSTDAPFVSEAFIARLHALARGYDAAVVNARGHHHALSAIYRCTLYRRANELLAADRRRLLFLVESSHTRFVSEAELLAEEPLRSTDPGLRALRNLNTPEEYVRALAEVQNPSWDRTAKRDPSA